jgi:Tfp pilus assembly protein PilX
MRPHTDPSNQRGVALVVAILVLAALSAIAMAMISTIVSDRQIASYDTQAQRALNNAEAGISEAVERIRRRDVPNNEDPKMVAQIFLTSAGDVPSVGTDTTALATGQPAGQWTAYSTTDQGPDVLTIQYKTNPARTQIYRYNPMNAPAVNFVSGSPIYVVTSVGRAGSARRKIVTEVTSPLLNPNLKGAGVAIAGNMHLQNNAFANGYDHLATTPAGTGSSFARTPTWESANMPYTGVVSSGKVMTNGGAVAIGFPGSAENTVSTYSGVWDALNMTQAEFFGMMGDPDPLTALQSPKGLTYVVTGSTSSSVTGAGKKVTTTTVASGNITGDGLLYIAGDLDIVGDFTFRGLIWCDGYLKIKSSGWILGAVVARQLQLNYGGVKPIILLASKEAVAQNISKYGSEFKTLSWRELDTHETATVSGGP